MRNLARRHKDLEKHVCKLAATVPQLMTVSGNRTENRCDPQVRRQPINLQSRSRQNIGGNKKIKNALWQSAFASINNHERSREYYNRKRSEHKRHNAAVMCLARRKVNVFFRKLKDGTTYNGNHPHQQQAT